MLTKIREKSQGVFSWVILIAICIPFALWGINNYDDNGREVALASVGDKDFFQRDVNKAYDQFSQSLRGLGLDEQLLKQQALQKLIKDEVLLQYVQARGLVVTDETIREFIAKLDYFQTEGRFDEEKYKSLLASQRLSSAEFVNRIKKALMMEQFQNSILQTSIATDYDVEGFFKIQNQQRDVEYMTITLTPATAQPTKEEIEAYYRQHQDIFQAPEQMSVEYVELSLAELAKKIIVTDEKLQAFYQEQKDQYTLPERRKISHILFAVNDKVTEQLALEKAQKAKQVLASKAFASVAADQSDDKVTAKLGGDLGLFNVGVMEKSFEDAAMKLRLNEVSEPVKSAFGYHLIKVTELLPVEIKAFDTVKEDLLKAYQKVQAENAFYAEAERLTELSYQNPDNLHTVAESLGLTIQKTMLFTKDSGEGVAADPKVRGAAFTDEVLQGNNSAAIELGADKVIVLRLLDHKPAASKELSAVTQEIVTVILNEKAKQAVLEKAKQVLARLDANESLVKLAEENKLNLKSLKSLTRRSTEVELPLREAIFKAAKPLANKPSIFSVPMANGDQVILSLNKVTEGVMSNDEKKQLEVAKKNIANTFAQEEFNAVLSSLEASADIKIKPAAPNKASE
ncbi:MAG: SurA N-terminal domain-containing protein [Methylovulum sp.]|jgi:peptidyl-prolyl cis-trans isomerase D|nr:SurA N-terminal domain-containing protein [Methylovulum sp.]